MDIPIVFEDTDIVVLNKPAGVVVNRAQTVKEQTVQDWVIARGFLPTSSGLQEKNQQVGESYVSTEEDFISRAGIVHRIDKETSGILLVAKNYQSFISLQDQFKQRLVTKTYHALIHGKLMPQEGEINAPIGRLPWNRERFGVVPGGKESLTKYRVLRHLWNKTQEVQISLVEVYPKTGRTHQIRVHFKYINFPLVGDYLYAGRKTSRDDRTWAPRVMLHAWNIAFHHPRSHDAVFFEAPIPEDFDAILSDSQ